ncbi:flagellar hook-length control protein FliK [Massilia sp. R2A-15]|uniref:flagellar hook-length control protein FliK n=1 Tax=Massilia sp. R2A-15 TaxID=3064278 RepID=UPI002733DFEE|nr:flagellar hook-length control protein FliK [Massilia sp. R2A-15]WLI87986.1 flagellar hook-length control protein FliK [Massilia sp. R2A-15]
MQTTTLPIQVSTPSPAPQRANAAPQADAAQFSQALTREMAQRQDSPAPAAPSQQAAKPQAAPASAAAPAAPPAKAESAKADDARPASASKDAVADEAQDDAADAAAVTPVADLIALVASFNQAPAASAPAADPVAAEAAVAAAAGGTGKQLKADLEPAAGKAAPAVGADEGKDALAAIEGAARFSVKELAGAAEKATGPQAAASARPAPAAGTKDLAHTAAPKADLGDAVAAPANAKAEAAPAPAPLHAEPAPLHAREAEVAAIKEPAPAAAAPLAAPLQQASLAVAEAVNGVPADRIAARVGTPGWDNQVGQKIIWMVAGKEQSATLTLNPPDMGPMQVVLNVHNDQASVTFSAAQPEVRQALENAMPKLREMMSESGIALGNASVDAGTPEQRQAQQGEQPRGHGAGGRFGNAGAIETPVLAPRAARSGGGAGLVDTFA